MTDIPSNIELILVSDRFSSSQIVDSCCKLCSNVGAIGTALDSLAKRNEYLWVGSGCQHGSPTSPYRINVNLGPFSTKHIDFCNNILWPHFHYLMPQIDYYDDDSWIAFQQVNQGFADVIIDLVEKTKCLSIWIHGLELLLLPRILRSKIPNIQIGYFLHVPFPSYETYRSIPWRNDILLGLLSADLIGLQTNEYYRHFFSAVEHLLGEECIVQGGIIRLASGHSVFTHVLPMSVDFKYLSGRAIELSKNGKCLLTKIKKGKKVILSLCRMDYSKGIPNLLRGYDELLRRYPNYQEKVILLLVLVDFDNGNEDLCYEIGTLIGLINGRYSKHNWEPVKFLSQVFSRDELIQLYLESEVCLVSPLRDGMNLVCKEYIAVRHESNDGTLVLSEFTGAAEILTEALQINPYDKVDVASKLHLALSMDVEQRQKIMQKLIEKEEDESVYDWADRFSGLLSKSASYNKQDRANNKLKLKNMSEYATNYTNANIILGISQYTISFIKKNKQAFLDSICNLAKQKSHILVVSYESIETLNEIFFDAVSKCTIVAEGGAFIRLPGCKVWIKSGHNDDSESCKWKIEIRSIFQRTVRSLPSTSLIESYQSVCFDYSSIGETFCKSILNELTQRLLIVSSRIDFHISRVRNFVQVCRDAALDADQLLHELKGKPVIVISDSLTAPLIRKLLRNIKDKWIIDIKDVETSVKDSIAICQLIYLLNLLIL